MLKIKIIKAISLGILSALFLSSGIIVNSLNAYHGGSWAWTASLRYLLLLPVLIVLVLLRGNLSDLIRSFKKIPVTFLLWGNLGFGGYYALLSYAIRIAPGWLVTAGFMTTVLAGILIAPFIYDDHRAKISKKALTLSSFLVISLVTMQFDHIAKLEHLPELLLSLGMALLAAFLWPLGNRKLMLDLERKEIKLDPMQRVLGMTVGSLPILIALSLYGFYTSGAPSSLQLKSSFIAVLFSGVVGSTLFFKALQMVSKNQFALMTVEATQVTGVLFTLFGEMIFKGTPWPGFYGNLGFAMMALSLGCYSWLSIKKTGASAVKNTVALGI
ncbi:multidrug resistance efflux transporter family protein [Pedobacter sp. AW31-3R]|uniref:multidrug resistance efflux transporter family protein n=1 Tax=Pedobacter sp. AW31-3R TaxID=3445781 RepID=UPI003FA1921D